MSHYLISRRDGAIQRIIMARPEKKNALTAAMYESMIATIERATRDPEVGAILFEGAGGNFTAGNDIADFIAHAASGATDMAALRFVRTIAACELPVVAAVDGVAIGVGTTMLLHCDLVYASPDARFRLPFVDLGLVPEAGSSLLLPRRIGPARASEMLLLGEMLEAGKACEYGLVNAVIEPAELSAHALAKAGALAVKPRNALRATRRLIRGDRADVLARIDEEAMLFAQALASDEARAAFAAFMARGKA